MTTPTAKVRLSALLVLLTALALCLAQAPHAQAASRSKHMPAAFKVLKSSTRSVSLDWKKVRGASGYRVRYAPKANMSGARSAHFRYSNGVVRGLKPGTRYWFRIAAAAKRGRGALQSSYTTAPYLKTSTKRTHAEPASGSGKGGGSGSGASYDLHAATFNISGVTNDSSRNAPWAERKAKVAAQLLGQNPSTQPGPQPDVIALQEANGTRNLGGGETQYTQLVAELNLLATGRNHYSTIPDITSLSTRIAFNDTTMTLLSAGAVKWDDQETVVDGKRYMPWAIFQVRSTGTRFFFGSDHLETASETVRRAQWNQLIADVPILSQGLPVILGGDFNSPRGAESRCDSLPNPTADVMLSQMTAAGFGDMLGQLRCSTRPLVSTARAEHVVNGNVNSLNRYQPSLRHYPNADIVGQDVDYLFASNALRVKDWEMVVDAQSGSYQLQDLIPSDHNMLRATVVLPGS